MFLVALILRTLYALCINFNETNTTYLQDYTQIYLIGLKFYTSQTWPYWGPDITYTASQIPGALQGLLVGLPFYFLEAPEAPFVLLNLLSGLALLFFGWYISKRITGIPKWFIYAWLFLAPWTMNFGTTTINPSYVLAPAILFFISIIDLLPIYQHRLLPSKLSFLLIGFSLGWILQIHMSWVLLNFYILVLAFFTARTKNLRTILTAVLFLGLGFLISISTLIPTIVKYHYALTNTGSVIVFNPSNFDNIDIVTRFISFSAFEVLYFTGGWEGAIALLQKYLWAAPLIIFLAITGAAQVIYYLVFFFKSAAQKEFRTVKIFTLLSILLVYVSYLFAIRDVANYTFYLMLPVAFWFSFYCLEGLFKRKFWKRFAVMFLLSSMVFYVILAYQYFDKRSLYSKYDLIENALTHKDSRLFARRRVANWEKAEREKAWKYSPLENESLSMLTYTNSFDSYEPEVVPECLNSHQYISAPYSCKLDTTYRYSPVLAVKLNNIDNNRKVHVSMNVMANKVNDCNLVISVVKNDSNLFWAGLKIANDPKKLNSWYKASFTQYFPEITDTTAMVNIMAWLPKSNTNAKVWIDDMQVEFE